MSWDIVSDSWDLFPVSQKWFATGEAIAHLKYLKEKGRYKKRNAETEDSVFYKRRSCNLAKETM